MRYTAFLRGINVGGRIVKMADLRICLQEAGYNHVSTVLQTGNVVLESDKKLPHLKKDLESLLSAAFNYPANVQVLTQAKLAKVVAGCSYDDRDGGFHAYVIFLEKGLEKQLAKEVIGLGKGEKVQLGDGVVYWRCAKGNTLNSAFGKQLSKAAYKDFNTNRNLKTLRKVLAA